MSETMRPGSTQAVDVVLIVFELESVFQHVDALFREYLLFRGFHETLEMFKRQKQRDKARGFQVSSTPSVVISPVDTFFCSPCCSE